MPYPSPVDPGSRVYLCLPIPNNTLYRQAVKGALSDLGKDWTWAQTIGADNQGAYEAAELMRAAIADSIYLDECGEIMSCDDVADCIENDPAVQAAIAEQLANNPGSQVVIYDTSRVGVPMLPGDLGAVVVTSDDCDRNSLFGSVTAIVDQLDRNNRDFLEIIEVGTNTRERISELIAAIPGFETLPINEAIDYLDKLQSEILENYEAQWTDALRDTYRCDLFCLALTNPECKLAFQDIYNYFDERLGAALDPMNLFAALVQYFISGTWAGSLVIDIMMLNQVAIWRATSNYVGISLRTLETVGLLGANDDDPDWEILCEDCPPGDWCIHFDAANDLATVFTPTGGLGPQAVFRDGGYYANDLLIPSRITLEMDLGGEYALTGMKLVFTGDPAPAPFNQVGWFREHFGAAIDGADFEQETILAGAISLQKSDLDVVSSFDASVPITVGLTDIYLYGTGPKPTDIGEDCEE